MNTYPALIVALIYAGVLASCNYADKPPTSVGGISVERAFEQRSRDVQVEGKGVVLKILADDKSGTPHQRFIIRLASGPTLLIAHNIKVAPRIDDLKEGDSISFFGEYVWNPEGGSVHWTHHDPAGLHVGGWLEHKGRTYQ